MKIPFSLPDITQLEIDAVAETLRSGWLTTGPKTKELENKLAEYCQAERAVCLNSQTASAEMTLRLLGIGEGDEVILPAYTYTATCSVVCHVGAVPVMIDCQKDSFEMDYQQLEQAVTPRTKCIIPVELGGKLCDYEKLRQIIEEKRKLFAPSTDLQAAFGRIILLADAAHALGAEQKGKKCGSLADFTTFSFHAVKNLTTGEGGAVVWKPIPGVKTEELYRQYMLLSLHGQSKDALEKTKLGSWEYDIEAPYYKCNMTDIMASLGLAQLSRYEGMLQRRREIISRYEQAFEDLPVQPMLHYGEDFASSGHLYLVRLPGWEEEKRNRLIESLAEEGIACNVHYKPLPLLTAYKKLGFCSQQFPNACSVYASEITLPLHSCLTEQQVDYVIEGFKKHIKYLI